MQAVLAPLSHSSPAVSVQELELAIAKLPPDQLAALGEWFDGYRADAWDRQIEADARAGRLDSLVREAQTDIVAGRVRPLP